ncbi:hypothetical protein WG66_004019 [Moniliophthora roreri]|nr:hypothetical protein WG66_004019 [Moniliophthora roreri]
MSHKQPARELRPKEGKVSCGLGYCRILSSLALVRQHWSRDFVEYPRTRVYSLPVKLTIVVVQML